MKMRPSVPRSWFTFGVSCMNRRVVDSAEKQGRESMSKAGVERTCNLFHCKAGPDLYCAVPEDLAVPAFLNNDWTYAGTLRDGAEYPCGFDRNAAVIGFRLIGFHLFQTAQSTQHPNGVCQLAEDRVLTGDVPGPSIRRSAARRAKGGQAQADFSHRSCP